MESMNCPLMAYVWTYPNYYIPSQTYYLAPLVAMEPDQPKISEDELPRQKSVM